MVLHQTKKLLNIKGIINETKGKPTEWVKIFSNNTSNEGLISKIYKELIELTTDKKRSYLKNGQKSWIDTFPKNT